MIETGRDIKVFTGTMDRDSEARYMKQGDYRYLLNGRTAINSQGSFGAVEDVMGNVLVNNAGLPLTGINKVIGAYEDIAGQSCIFFVYNSDGYHGIYRWFANSQLSPNGAIETIYQVRIPSAYDDSNPNPLGFDPNHLITGVNLVENLLYWTDFNKEPKEINIVRANNTNKKLSWNIYFNELDAGINGAKKPTTYIFRLYQENVFNPVYQLSFFAFKNTVQLIVIEFVNAINADPLAPQYVTVQNFGNYATITSANIGNYCTFITSTSAYPSSAIPANHYADYVFGTAFTYPPLTEDVLKRVKYPPFCGPKAEYELLSNSGTTRVELRSLTVNNPGWGHSHTGYLNGYDIGNINPPLTGSQSDDWWVTMNVSCAGAWVYANAYLDFFGNLYLEIDNSSWFTPGGACNGPVSFTPIYFSNNSPPVNYTARQNQVVYLGFQNANGGSYVPNMSLLNNSARYVVQSPEQFYAGGFFTPNFTGSYNVQISFDITHIIQAGTTTDVSIKVMWVEINAGTVINRLETLYDNLGVLSVVKQVSKSFKFTVSNANYYYGVAVYINDLEVFSNTSIDTSFSKTRSYLDYLAFSNGDFTIYRTTYDVNNLYQNPYMFRARYIFEDYEESVLSAYSNLPLALNENTKFINVIYDDKWLLDQNYLPTIKFVELYVSKDNGTTWGRFERLERPQFVPSGNRIVKYEKQNAYLALDPATALLQFHAVPLKSRSQEYIDDRIFDGALLEGYDSINIDVDIDYKILDIYNSPQYNNIPSLSHAAFRYGWKGYIGIVYYDNADRKSGVCVADLNIQSIPQIRQITTITDLSTQAQLPYFNIEINNEPPSWATKYQIVITKDIEVQKYILFIPQQINKADINLNISNTNPVYWEIDLSSIPYYVDNSNLGTKVSYTFVDGDRVRIIAYTDGSKITTDYDIPILQSISNKIYIPYDAALPFFINLGTTRGNNCLLEIYTPVETYDYDELVFYEIGECHEIGQVQIGGVWKKFHKAPIKDQNLITGTPAELNIFQGGAYYRSRIMYSYPFASTTWTANDPLMIWSGTVNDYIDFDTDGFGRTNAAAIIGQIYRPAAIRFSDKFVSGTQLNGLSANQPLNEQQYAAVYGNINKMQVVNNDILKLIFGNSYQLSIYVSQGVIRQAQGTANLISISDEVAGNSHIIQRTLGTINAESVVLNDEGDMFGYDENEGVVWVASGNGLIQISDRGMKSIFKNYSNERKATLAVSQTPSIYDLYHDEYIITLNDIQNAPGTTTNFTGVTIAYNKQKGGWTSYYSFVPEYYGRVRDYVVSFLQGQLYLHDRNTIAKNFYGVQYSRELTYVTNKDFPKVRDFKAISINGIGLNDLPTIRVLPFEGYPNGMLSLLTKRFFKTLEGVQYAYFQKDRLTPGMSANPIDALANGRNLKGQVLEVTLVNNDTIKSSIYSSEIIYFYSEHS